MSEARQKTHLDRSAAPCHQCVLVDQCPEGVSAARLSERRATSGVSTHLHGAGTVLLREGQPSQHFVFVKSGLVVLRQTGLDGVDRPIAVTGRGALLGQHAFHGLPSLTTAQALTPVSVCEIPFALLRLYVSSGGHEDLACLLGYKHQLFAQLLSWGHLTRMPALEQRLAAALHLLAAAQAPLAVQMPSQAALAELLCVTRESVNRVWREFEAAGLVKWSHGRAVDLDRPRLGLMLGQPA